MTICLNIGDTLFIVGSRMIGEQDGHLHRSFNTNGIAYARY
jgi:hypothetical protein